MGYSFRPARRENTALIIGFIGASGSGKTFSAMLVAIGLAYPGMSDAEIIATIAAEGRSRIAFIDTERGRALHYAPPKGQAVNIGRGWFPFDHLELDPPFRPSKYSDAIKAAEAAGYRVIVVDSASHEWAGEGGVLGYQGEEQYTIAKRGLGDREPDWKRLEQVKAASWIKPKGEHNEFIGILTTRKAHVLVCLRAKQVVELREVIVDGRKKTEWISPKGRPAQERWTPICHDDFPFELTMSFIVCPNDPGRPIPLKLQEQHRAFVDLEDRMGVDTGRRLAEWSAGAVVPSDGGDAQAGGQAQGGAPAKRTPGQMVDGYISRLDALESREAMLALQLDPKTQAFVDDLKAKHPDEHQRLVAANTRRAAELADDDPPAANEDRGGQGSGPLDDPWPDADDMIDRMAGGGARGD
jgi:hypothetical protein